MSESVVLWTSFSLIIIGMILLELKVFRRKLQAVGIPEALAWTGAWVLLAIIFKHFLHYYLDKESVLEFLIVYLTQLSLSADHIFVILTICLFFNVPPAYQYKALLWGIAGALVMRVIFIFTGALLIQKISWLLYIFGALLVFAGVRRLISGNRKFEPEKNPLITLLRKVVPVSNEFEIDNFFTRRDHKTWATPLFLVVVMIGVSDLAFAASAIPAAFAISNDIFTVYAANVFAIMALRSLYFVLA